MKKLIISLSLLLGIVLCLLVLGNTPFVDRVIKIKEVPLSKNEEGCARAFVAKGNIRSPYLNALHFIFAKQLKIKMGKAAVSRSFLDQKVDELIRNFLKDKLNMHQPITPEWELAKKAKWDPHHHASSIYAALFPGAYHLLPNFDLAYVYLSNERKKNPKDYALFVLEAMAEESFAEVTETGCNSDKWHLEHKGKKFVPLFCHKREQGSVLRADVSGYDFCGPEKEDRYESVQSFFQSIPESKVVRVHMGETIIPQRGRANITLLLDEAEKYFRSDKPLRIGHGTHISLDDMLRVAKKGYYIEACLTSNKRNGVIEKRSDYPLGIMMLLDVKVVIGTDGGPLYSTHLALEYAYAKRNLEKFCQKLHTSDELIALPNGDHLCMRHIGLEGDKFLTFKELGKLMKPSDYEKLSPEILVKNAQELSMRNVMEPHQALKRSSFSTSSEKGSKHSFFNSGGRANFL